MKNISLLLGIPLILAGCSSSRQEVVGSSISANSSSVPETPLEDIPLSPANQAFISAPAEGVADADLKTSLIGIWQLTNRARILVYRFFPDGRYDLMSKVTPNSRGLMESGTYKITGPQTLEKTTISKSIDLPIGNASSNPGPKTETMRIQGDSLFHFMQDSRTWLQLRRLSVK